MKMIKMTLAAMAILLTSGVATAQTHTATAAQKTMTKQSQERPAIKNVTMCDDVKTVEQEKVFDAVEQQACFPGGHVGLSEWLSANLRYPEQAWNNGEQGRVVVSFVVETDGQITNPVVVRSVSPALDAEAIRVVESMPKWSPGKNNGVAVRSRFALPIAFKINAESAE